MGRKAPTERRIPKARNVHEQAGAVADVVSLLVEVIRWCNEEGLSFEALIASARMAGRLEVVER